MIKISAMVRKTNIVKKKKKLMLVIRVVILYACMSSKLRLSTIATEIIKTCSNIELHCKLNDILYENP